jgi:hypothetical protein
MRLAYWSSVWFDGDFEPPSGVVRRFRLPNPRDTTQRLPGFFAIERTLVGRRITLALYQLDGTLFLQAGTRRWELSNPLLRFQFDVLPSGVFSRFRVFEEGHQTWELTYSHVGRALHAVIDPTYDVLEMENDHFLAFVASAVLSPEWQENARSHLLALKNAL